MKYIINYMYFGRESKAPKFKEVELKDICRADAEKQARELLDGTNIIAQELLILLGGFYEKRCTKCF